MHAWPWSSKDMKFGSKLKILPDVMVNKDGAEENAHVMIVMNSREMQKEETYLHVTLLLTGNDCEARLHGLDDTEATNQFI